MSLNRRPIPDLALTPTNSDIIADYIRQAIVTGSLDSGMAIRQDEIAGQFNVSKIPVREALKKLEAEGLVNFQRNKGAIVTSLSVTEIVQIFEVRAVLEASALRFSVPMMTKETFIKAKEFCDAFTNESNISLWSELNWKFHSCLYENANRPYLLNMIRKVNNQVERYLRIQLCLSHGKEQAVQEHEEILALCVAGDADKAGDYLHTHIMAACDSLIHALSRTR